MRDRHARDRADRPALFLERDGDRLDRAALRIDVDGVVVGLAARAERRGGGGRVGDGMRPRAVAADQIAEISPNIPGGPATESRIVATGSPAPGVPHGLRVDIECRAVVRRTRHAQPVIGRGPAIVLERKTGAPARVVGNATASGNRGRSRRRPIQSIEDDEDDPLLAGRGGGELQPMDVCLIEVVGVGVQRRLGQPAVELGQLRWIAIDAPRTGDALERHAKRIDRNQPIGMIRPCRIPLWLIAPVAPGRVAGSLGGSLQFTQRIGGCRSPLRPRQKHEHRGKGKDCGQPYPSSLMHRQAGRSSHIGHQSGTRGKSCAASFCATCVEDSSRPAAAASCGSHWPSSSRVSSSADSRR